MRPRRRITLRGAEAVCVMLQNTQNIGRKHPSRRKADDELRKNYISLACRGNTKSDTMLCLAVLINAVKQA